jgi:Ca2+-binding EF-hand superfamily protein
VYPKFTVEEFDGDGLEEPDPAILAFVESVWGDYDDDGSEELDRVEAWRFCQDFLREKVNKANFEEMYLLTDKDESGSLSKEEIALFMTKICRRV